MGYVTGNGVKCNAIYNQNNDLIKELWVDNQQLIKTINNVSAKDIFECDTNSSTGSWNEDYTNLATTLADRQAVYWTIAGNTLQNIKFSFYNSSGSVMSSSGMRIQVSLGGAFVESGFDWIATGVGASGNKSNRYTNIQLWNTDKTLYNINLNVDYVNFELGWSNADGYYVIADGVKYTSPNELKAIKNFGAIIGKLMVQGSSSYAISLRDINISYIQGLYY